MRQLYLWLDKIWQWIAEKVFVRFEFDLKPEQLTPAHRVVFALTTGGIIEWLILSSWCRSQGLGAIAYSNRKRILILANPKYFFQVLFRRKTYADLFLAHNEGPRLLFCPPHERKEPFTPSRVESLLSELYVAQRSRLEHEGLKIYPVFLLWRRYARSQTRLLSEYLFGLSSDPNLIGKVWYLIRKRRDSTVRLLTPLSLEPKESEAVDGEESEPMRVAKAARRRILVTFHQEMRVILGPRYLSPHSVKETLMRDPEIQRMIDEVAQKEGVDRKKIAMRAYQNLTEIAANYRFRFIEVMYVFLNWLFTRVFDGLISDEKEIGRLRDTLRTKPVVLVPCHRSHLDYLVIPYLMFVNEMVTPHTAAGINLAFWPMGIFLRFGGAFFIRRSFRGDVLYSTCLRKYFQYLLSNRYNVMFFIEGTRSRTGKMLPPQYGMLKMILEAQEARLFDDIALFPMAITYDEVPEERAYTKELTGGQKTKESAAELIKSRKLIKRNIGKVYVRVAPPISTKEQLSAADQGMVDRKLVLQKTAFQISKSINDCTPITPKSLVCSTLLGWKDNAPALDTLLTHCDALARYVSETGSPLSVPQGDAGFLRAAEQSVKRLVKSGVLTVTDSTPRYYKCEARKRVLLNFYKNGSIHSLVLPSISLTALFLTYKDHGVLPPKDFQNRVIALALEQRNYLKFDFFFSPTQQFQDEMDKTLSYFAGVPDWKSLLVPDLFEALEKRQVLPQHYTIYQRLLGDLWESYYTALSYINDNPAATIEKKNLTHKITKEAEDKLQKNALRFAESVSTQNYTNALSLFENLDILRLSKEGEKTAVQYLGWTPAAQKLSSDLKRYLDYL